MIHVFCTKSLASKGWHLLRRYDPEEIPMLDKWCANLLEIRGSYTVVVMCADTRFGFVMKGLSYDQFFDLPKLIASGIRKTFSYYGIRPEITDDYLSDLPILCTGASRKMIGMLNRLSMTVSMMHFRPSPRGLFPMRYASAINDMSVDISKNSYVPLERMLSCLEERYHMKPISRPAFEMTAVLDLEDSKAVRVLRVPASYTFQELHSILLGAFGWNEPHPGVFRRTDRKTLQEGKAFPAKGVLSSCLAEHDTFLYQFESLDHWTVSIHVDAIIPEYEEPHPLCIACEGTSPPEGVGGTEGFRKFMEAYNDRSHPDHAEAEKRFRWSWSKDPDIRMINVSIRR